MAQQFFVKQENGRYRATSKLEVVQAASSIILDDHLMRRDFNPLTSPEMTRQFLKTRMILLEHEVFSMIFLDNRHRVVGYEELFRGTIDGASVHPREVVKAVLAHNAAAVILAHNHPSGISEPSQADLRITQRLKEALALIDVRILDHMIVGSPEITSLAERGLL